MQNLLKNTLNTNDVFLSSLLVLLFFLSGCTAQNSIPLMPAPVIFQGAEVDPYSHLNHEEKTTSMSVFYATNRESRCSSGESIYGNGMSDRLHLGEVQIRFGDDLTSWDDLYLASTRADQPDPIHLSLEKTREIATVHTDEFHPGNLLFSPSLKEFADKINDKLAKARDKEIIIYVHGAKGSFLKSVTLTAEIAHFSGRDFIGIGFSWPSHQNIVSYIVGTDAQRARHSTSSLRTLLEFLAKYTEVKNINIIGYSAGGKLVSRAIHEMRQNHPLLSSEVLRRTFKLGTILFTAADVSVDRFLERLPAISEMVQQVVVTVSDADEVLYSASIIMGGNDRISTEDAEGKEKEFVLSNKISNFEIVDFSFGKEARGFDIKGHHYWHRHPWASSDIIFLLRTDLPAEHRGLSPSDIEGIWYLSEEYPDRVKRAVKKELQGQW